jgi:hypothetical protein
MGAAMVRPLGPSGKRGASGCSAAGQSEFSYPSALDPGFHQRTVFAPDARDRFRRRVPPVNASLVRNRQALEATGLLASLCSARKIPDYRYIRTVPTTRNALPRLLARLVCDPSSISPPRLRHRGHSIPSRSRFCLLPSKPLSNHISVLRKLPVPDRHQPQPPHRG